jgi:hypothetical protein
MYLVTFNVLCIDIRIPIVVICVQYTGKYPTSGGPQVSKVEQICLRHCLATFLSVRLPNALQSTILLFNFSLVYRCELYNICSSNTRRLRHLPPRTAALELEKYNKKKERRQNVTAFSDQPFCDHGNSPCDARNCDHEFAILSIRTPAVRRARDAG